MQHPQDTYQALTAQEDAEKLHALMEIAQEGIGSPGLLAEIMGALFGPDSPEARAVAPPTGARELAITQLRQQRQMLRQASKRLTQQIQAITREIERLDAEERKLAEAGVDTALLDVLNMTSPKEAAAMFDKYRDNPRAMGLLAGSLDGLDMIQRQELKNRIWERL